MSRAQLNILLAVLLVALLAANWFGARDYRKPNYLLLPNMVHTPRYNAYSPNQNFKDGKTLQPPPAGTIPRGTQPLSYKATPEDALRAGLELTSPITPEDAPAALERGTILFNRFCLPCHGPAGAGDGTVAKRGFPPPAALSADHAKQMKDGQIFHIITYGQGSMPSHASQINPDDRWRIVQRVRQLQIPPPAPAPAPTPAPADGAVAAATDQDKAASPAAAPNPGTSPSTSQAAEKP